MATANHPVKMRGHIAYVEAQSDWMSVDDREQFRRPALLVNLQPDHQTAVAHVHDHDYANNAGGFSGHGNATFVQLQSTEIGLTQPRHEAVNEVRPPPPPAGFPPAAACSCGRAITSPVPHFRLHA